MSREVSLLRRHSKKIFIHIFIILLATVMIYPLLWLLGSSFKPDNEIFTTKSIFPGTFTTENYVNGWKGLSGYTFGHFFMNSFFVCFMCVLGNFFCNTMAAYAFARIDFTFKKILFAVMIVTLMLPFHVMLIPQYIIFKSLGWVNTYLPFIVPKFLGGQGFFIFLLVQFMRTIPVEIESSGKIDGCNRFTMFTRLMLPLTIPAIVTMSIFTFLWTWDDVFSQLLYLSSIPKFTISIALRMFIDATGGSSWGSLFAMSVLSLVPQLVIFIFFQKYIIEGIVSGAIKG